MTTQYIDDAKIAEAAFELWLAEGRPHGRDQDHWFRAVEALKTAAPAPKKRKAATKPKADAAPKKAAKPRARKAKPGKTEV